MDDPPRPRAPHEQAEIAVRALAHHIDAEAPPGYQFLLFLVSTGADGFLTYISNIERLAAVRTVEEWAAAKRAEKPGSEWDLARTCTACGSVASPRISCSGRAATVRLCMDCFMALQPEKP